MTWPFPVPALKRNIDLDGHTPSCIAAMFKDCDCEDWPLPTRAALTLRLCTCLNGPCEGECGYNPAAWETTEAEGG